MQARKLVNDRWQNGDRSCYPLETDVLIVGAGPTGLALAAALQKAGVDHLLVDALERRAEHLARRGGARPYARDARADRRRRAAGGAGHRAVALHHPRPRPGACSALSFDALPSAFRHLLMVPQSTTEARAAERGWTELGGARASRRRGARRHGRIAAARPSASSTAEGEQDDPRALCRRRRRHAQRHPRGGGHRLPGRGLWRILRSRRRPDGLAAGRRRGVAVLLARRPGGRGAAARRIVSASSRRWTMRPSIRASRTSSGCSMRAARAPGLPGHRDRLGLAVPRPSPAGRHAIAAGRSC